MLTSKPLRISIHALGGQGGGVLADWVVALAEGQGWHAQSTSVPGVAQRTGTTLYYVELAPPGPEPVMALMPVPGDVDIVIAAELMEAGRAIARGLVTPERTVLIASSHRIFAIGEKVARGDGRFGTGPVSDACRASARVLILEDFDQMARDAGSLISASLFGALAASRVLPFPVAAFESVIVSGGIGVEASLRAFRSAQHPQPPERPGSQPLVTTDARIRRLPEPVQRLAALGAAKLLDYQDRRYASAYLDRVESMAAAEAALGGGLTGFPLTVEVARRLALSMAYEDVFRVADLKTRGTRFARVRTEARAAEGQIIEVTEFLHPRFDELCDSLPRALGEWLAGSERAQRLLQPLFRPREVRTSGLFGFVMLWSLARLRRLRPATLRHAHEMAAIDSWLASVVNAAREDPGLALELARLKMLATGYGETASDGRRRFAAIMASVPGLVGRADAAGQVARLRAAALEVEADRALADALAALHSTPSPKADELAPA